MARRLLPVQVARQMPVCSVILALVALCLRLSAPIAMPAAPVATADHLAIVAAFGEHALCLTNTPAERDAGPQQQAPPSGKHAGHDCFGCCTSVAAASGIVARALGIRIRFEALRVAPPEPVLAAASPYRLRPAEPRGPPALG